MAGAATWQAGPRHETCCFQFWYCPAALRHVIHYTSIASFDRTCMGSVCLSCPAGSGTIPASAHKNFN